VPYEEMTEEELKREFVRELQNLERARAVLMHLSVSMMTDEQVQRVYDSFYEPFTLMPMIQDHIDELLGVNDEDEA
jgi:hypothetical protein